MGTPGSPGEPTAGGGGPGRAGGSRNGCLRLAAGSGSPEPSAASPAAARQRAPRPPLGLRLLPALAPGPAGPWRGGGKGRRRGGRAGGGTATSRRPLGRAPAAEAGSRACRAPLRLPAASRRAALAKMSREPGCNRWLLFAACAHLLFLLPPLRTRGEWPGAGPGRHGEGKGGDARSLRGGGEREEGTGQNWKAWGGCWSHSHFLTPLSRPVRESGRGGWTFPLKFVSELGWSADGAARAPLSGPGSEVTVPAGAQTGSRPPGPAAVCGDKGVALSPGPLRGRGKRSSRGRPLRSGKSSLKE